MNALSLRAIRVCALLAMITTIGGAAASEDSPVQLPPVIVSETTATRPWRYVKSGDLEVLSRCSDGDTVRIIERETELMELLDLALPPEFQFRTTMPLAMVLVEANEAPASARRIVGSPATRFLPNLELMDVDAFILFEILDQSRLDHGRISFSAEHLEWLIDLRAPPLPRWVSTGYHRLFRGAKFGPRDVQFPPMRWRSPAETRELSADPGAPRELLPLADFFRHDVDPRIADETAWQAQAELLVRWCLATPQRRDAFRRFVIPPNREPWEVRLRTCFGMGPTDLRDRLSDELPDAVGRALVLELPRRPRVSAVEVRLARPEEITRIKGEWDRLAALYVRRHHPEFAAAYVGVANRTVNESASAANDDAGVMAARGLYEIDLGNPERARPWLEAAAARSAVRPRVHVELARMRLDDAIAAVGPEGILSPAQAEVVLTELARAQGKQPPLAATDAIAAEVWFRARARLDPARREALQAALTRYPKHSPLLYWAAAFCAQNGAREMASVLAQQGVAVADSADRKASFEKLLVALQERSTTR